MTKGLDIKLVDTALKRAARRAAYGPRDERTGRFLVSSVIASVDYDEGRRELDIVFTSGKTYRYFDVPLAIYADFLDASSKGAFFNANIKDVFRFVEVSNQGRGPPCAVETGGG